MSILFRLRPFAATDFPEYHRWFADPELRTTLGGVDAEWLAYVLNDTTGQELAVCAGAGLVGVIGVTFPTDGEGCPVITNLAIKPDRRRQGIGTRALRLLTKTIPAAPGQCWTCYVALSNRAAQRFFVANQWTRMETTDMVRYEYRVGVADKPAPRE
ncbi:GNAT family N-acetyltransferase [Lewinella sp. IMCC34183]|uniref:GNAT family N-acetyltransferase n=1 Tax=Lewinella sp. IMCC34183 TaxID=2248762 RepID=UPI001300AA23|nr:GNAT family N-acetyltransferase [Lewinella sp. IMCC34183]